MHRPRIAIAGVLIAAVAVAAWLLGRRDARLPAPGEARSGAPARAAPEPEWSRTEPLSEVARRERVEDELDANLVVKVLGPDSSVVGGASIELWIGGSAVLPRRTDAEGLATYALDEGVRVERLRVTASGFAPYSHEFSPAQRESLRLRRAAVAVIAKLALDSEVTGQGHDGTDLKVEVAGPDSSPVGGARVELNLQKDVVMTERTRADGVAWFDLDTGARVTHLHVTASGFARYRHVFSASELEASRAGVGELAVTVDLAPSGSVEVTAVSDSGRMLVAHQVSLHLVELHETVSDIAASGVESPISAVTDARGKAVFEHVCIGEWQAVSYPWMGYDGSLRMPLVEVHSGHRAATELVVPERDESALALGP